jgi:hypothetical protein
MIVLLIILHVFSFITAYVVTKRFKETDPGDITIFLIPLVNTIILIAYIIDNVDTNIIKLFRKWKLAYQNNKLNH